MARPKKNDSEKLSKLVGFKLTVSENNVLLSECKKAVLSKAEYARKRYLGNEIEIRVVSKVDESLVKEVIRIGVNINQIQKAINTQIKAEKEIDLTEINKALNNALQELYLIRGAVL